MAVNEWLNSDGTITRYDGITNQVLILAANYAPIGDVRDATPEERATNDELYPPREPAPSPSGVTRDQMVGSLISALGIMRSITADEQITADEISLAITTVGPSLYLLRDYGKSDIGIAYLTDLLLSQAVLALLTLVNNAKSGIMGTSAAIISVRQDLQLLKDEFDQYKTDHP